MSSRLGELTLNMFLACSNKNFFTSGGTASAVLRSGEVVPQCKLSPLMSSNAFQQPDGDEQTSLVILNKGCEFAFKLLFIFGTPNVM